jgi:hypothetical protein
MKKKKRTLPEIRAVTRLQTRLFLPILFPVATSEATSPSSPQRSPVVNDVSWRDKEKLTRSLT